MTWNSEYFYGNKISTYGLENGRIDYATLARSFNHILNNNIMSQLDDWDIVNGTDYDEETDSYYDIYQFYIIDENGYEILKEFTDEIVFYNSTLDIYLWGVTHYGTSWDYVLTDIHISMN